MNNDTSMKERNLEPGPDGSLGIIALPSAQVLHNVIDVINNGPGLEDLVLKWYPAVTYFTKGSRSKITCKFI